jgi:hypothetical protein
MSHTVPSQHPAVVLRSSYRHLRALLAVALIAIAGLTIAVVVLATSDTTTISPAAQRTAAPTTADPSAQTGAKLDHSGRKPDATQLDNQLNSKYFYPGHY